MFVCGIVGFDFFFFQPVLFSEAAARLQCRWGLSGEARGRQYNRNVTTRVAGNCLTYELSAPPSTFPAGIRWLHLSHVLEAKPLAWLGC